jgi:nucleoside-diphosphate-sugar epimerase
MHALVTGGAGFIGSHLVMRLLERGDTVRVFDNLSHSTRANLARVEADLEFIEGDLRDLDAVQRAVARIEVVFHEGALGSVPRSIADPATSFEVNANGTLNVLVAAREAGVRRLIYASSSSVYGRTPSAVMDESMAPAPVSPYAVSKLAAEQMCTAFTRTYGLETVSLRYFNVFGPRQNPWSPYAAVIPRFLNALSRGERPTIYGDGKQSRAFTYVGNVVDGNLRAVDTAGVAGEVFNIAADETTSVNELLCGIASMMGVTADPEYVPARTGDIRDSRASIAKATRLLNFRVTTSFADGLAKTVAAYLADRQAGNQGQGNPR